MGTTSKFDHASSCANVQSQLTTDHDENSYLLILCCNPPEFIYRLAIEADDDSAVMSLPRKVRRAMKLKFRKMQKKHKDFQPYPEGIHSIPEEGEIHEDNESPIPKARRTDTAPSATWKL